MQAASGPMIAIRDLDIANVSEQESRGAHHQDLELVVCCHPVREHLVSEVDPEVEQLILSLRVSRDLGTRVENIQYLLNIQVSELEYGGSEGGVALAVYP